MRLIHGDYNPSALAVRADIHACLHKYCTALDLRQWSMLDQVFHEDAICQLSLFGGPWREWLETVKALLTATKATQHQIGNTLFFVDDEAMFTETYVTAHHHISAEAPPRDFLGGTGVAHDVIMGSRYIDRFEHRNGNWRIAKRLAVAQWRQIQPCL